jgi:hypothetical protein
MRNSYTLTEFDHHFHGHVRIRRGEDYGRTTMAQVEMAAWSQEDIGISR